MMNRPVEIRPPKPPSNAQQFQYARSLVDAYTHQLGEPMVHDAVVYGHYEGCKQNIATLWATEEGRDGLFPGLVQQNNARDTALDARRMKVADRIAILFEPATTVAEVAHRQGAKMSNVRATLRTAFRNVAIVQLQRPELLEGPPVPFRRDYAWAWNSPLKGIRDNAMRTEIEAVFGKHLSMDERRLVIQLYGLDGRGVRMQRDIAGEFGLSTSDLRTKVDAILARVPRDTIDCLTACYIDISQNS